MESEKQPRNYVVDILAVIFGIGAWLAVNGIWVELPILVNTLPEGWNLPSYLSLITQIANIGPIIYGVLHQLSSRKVHETSATIVMMIIGTVACFLLAFFWKDTLYVGGNEHSVALFTLVFFISLVDCTSSVVFLPFMGFFKDIYLVSYFIGEGLSGFLPSIIALIQGVGGNPSCQNQTTIINATLNETDLVQVTPQPNFSAEVFFFCLCGMMGLSFASFLILRFTSVAASERVTTFSKHVIVEAIPTNPDSDSYERLDSSDDSPPITTIYGTGDTNHVGSTSVGTVALLSDSSDQGLDRTSYGLLLFIQAWVSFFQNGILMSIQSYTCLPYGNLAYHLTVTLSNIAAPLASFVTFFLPARGMWLIIAETSIASVIGAYILSLAATSPFPPLVNSASGIALVVTAWILFSGIVSHIKASLGMIFKKHSKRALFWCGAVNQIGAATGSIIMFLLVNVYSLFKSNDPCLL